MEFGAHLPVLSLAGEAWSIDRLTVYARTASQLGFRVLSANDHMVYSRPHLDALTALTVAMESSGQMTLMTSIALLVIRGAAPMAKALAAIDVLSGGRLIVGAGPGSSPKDYETVGVPFEERWKRFDELVPTLRRMWKELEPHPAQDPIPVWIGSWGSEAGLQRTARLGDGWLASAYHSTAEHFSKCTTYLTAQLERSGKMPGAFPNAIATMYLHLTDDAAEANAVLRTLVSPHQAPPDLRDRSLVGAPDDCIHKLRRLQAAGAQEVFVWPVRDEVRQLTRFADDVFPHFIER